MLMIAFHMLGHRDLIDTLCDMIKSFTVASESGQDNDQTTLLLEVIILLEMCILRQITTMAHGIERNSYCSHQSHSLIWTTLNSTR